MNALLDSHLASFASSFPESTSGSALSERERERTRWRDGLLEIWTIAEPIPGTEGDPHVIGRVSAFLVLLEKLSADVKDDDDSALVTRGDIGKVWWDTLLRRTILGTPKEVADDSKDKSRGRKPAKKGKEIAAPLSGNELRPLTVSRMALAAATRTVVWGMCPTIADLERDQDFVSPFCSVIRAEYETRSLATLRGGDEWYGLRNVAECFMAWADKQPKVSLIRLSRRREADSLSISQAYFERSAPYITPTAPSRVAFLSLLLHFLCRHSGKAYHVLQTPLLSNLINFCLTSPSPAAVTLGIKSLTMFLVALPVIIGDHLFGIMAVFGRAVSWEMPGELEDAGFEGESSLLIAPRGIELIHSPLHRSPYPRGGIRRSAARSDGPLHHPLWHLPLQLCRLPQGCRRVPQGQGVEGSSQRRRAGTRLGDHSGPEQGEFSASSRIAEHELNYLF